MKLELKDLSVAARLVIVGIVIFSIAYPLLVALGGQIWRGNAQGSLVEYKGEIVGSKLIGQDFEDPRFFHGRPSSIDYNAMKSGSSNLGPNNPELTDRVEKILSRLSENEDNLKVPSDLVTESGSALDPHISENSAMLQVPRIAEHTPLSENTLRDIVEKHTKEPLLGIYGRKRVNVLLLNIEIMSLIEEG